MPIKAIDALEEKAVLGGLQLEEVLTSSDGTRKLLLRTVDGHSLETVLIPCSTFIFHVQFLIFDLSFD